MCILQGPVAVQHCLTKDRPIAEILGGCQSNLVIKVLQSVYHGDASKVPVKEYLALPFYHTDTLLGVKKFQHQSLLNFVIEAIPSDINAWFGLLSGPHVGWLSALLHSAHFVQGSLFIDNPIRRLLTPRIGQKFTVEYVDGKPISLQVYGGIRDNANFGSFKAIEILYNSTNKIIQVTLFESRRGSSIPLQLQFNHVNPGHIVEITAGRNQRIKQFYWRLWYGDQETLPAISICDTFRSDAIRIEASAVETFCSVIGNRNGSYKSSVDKKAQAPMDYAIVAGWKVRCHLRHFPISDM